MLQLSRAEELALRVQDLTESRADVVDAADAERRRIERDLHDGAQQRLVVARDEPGHGAGQPDRCRSQGAARPSSTRTTRPSRRWPSCAQLVRGLHPAVLDDRGLDAALSGHRRPLAGQGAPERGCAGAAVADRGSRGLLRRLRSADQRGQTRAGTVR